MNLFIFFQFITRGCYGLLKSKNTRDLKSFFFHLKPTVSALFCKSLYFWFFLMFNFYNANSRILLIPFIIIVKRIKFEVHYIRHASISNFLPKLSIVSISIKHALISLVISYEDGASSLFWVAERNFTYVSTFLNTGYTIVEIL